MAIRVQKKEKHYEAINVYRSRPAIGSGGSSDGTIRLTADPNWDSVNGYTF